MRGELILGLGMAVLAMGCEEASEPASSWSPSLVVPAEPAVPPEGLRPAAAREGSSVARFGSHLVIADEDTSALRIAELPLRHLDGELAHREVALPGPPAQVLALSDRFLVTVRDPGLLLAFGWEDGELVELGRIELARDAWGIGVSPDGATALVTSAWTRVVMP